MNDNELEELEIGIGADDSDLDKELDKALDKVEDFVDRLERIGRDIDFGTSIADNLSKELETEVDKAIKNISNKEVELDLKANVKADITAQDKTSSKSMQDKSTSSSGKVASTNTTASAVNMAASANMAKTSNDMKNASGNIKQTSGKMVTSAKNIGASGDTFKAVSADLGNTSEELVKANTDLGTVSDSIKTASSGLNDIPNSIKEASSGLNNIVDKTDSVAGNITTASTSLNEASVGIGNVKDGLNEVVPKIGTAGKKLDSTALGIGNATSKLGKASSVLDSSSRNVGWSIEQGSYSLVKNSEVLVDAGAILYKQSEATGRTIGHIGTVFDQSSDLINDASGTMGDASVDLSSASITFDDAVSKLVSMSKAELFKNDLSYVQQIFDSLGNTIEEVVENARKSVTKDKHDRVVDKFKATTDTFNASKEQYLIGVDEGTITDLPSVRLIIDQCSQSIELINNYLEAFKGKVRDAFTVTREEMEFLDKFYGVKMFSKDSKSKGKLVNNLNSKVGPVDDPTNKNYQSDNPAVKINRYGANSGAKYANQIKGITITSQSPDFHELYEGHKKYKANPEEFMASKPITVRPQTDNTEIEQIEDALDDAKETVEEINKTVVEPQVDTTSIEDMKEEVEDVNETVVEPQVETDKVEQASEQIEDVKEEVEELGLMVVDPKVKVDAIDHLYGVIQDAEEEVDDLNNKQVIIDVNDFIIKDAVENLKESIKSISLGDNAVDIEAPRMDTDGIKEDVNQIREYIRSVTRGLGEIKTPAALRDLREQLKLDGVDPKGILASSLKAVENSIVGTRDKARELKDNLKHAFSDEGIKETEDKIDDLKEKMEELNEFKSDNAEEEVKDIGDAAGKSGIQIGELVNELKGYAGAYFGFEAIKTGITNAMQAIEIGSTSASVFGDSLGEMDSWLREMNDTLGLSYERTQRFTTMITQMGKVMGMSTSDSMLMSQQMALVAEQASRFYDVDVADVYDDMKDAVVGSYDALEKYGIKLEEAEVEAYAASAGISNAMAATEIISNRLGISQEYLAQSMKRPGVQASLLQDNLGALSTALGRCFMPILTVVLPLLNTLTQALTTVINNIANFISSVFALFGVEVAGASQAVTTQVEGIGDAIGGLGDVGLGDIGGSGGTGAIDDAADSVDGLGDSASGAAKEMKVLKGLMGFDEIQTIKTQQDSSGGGSGGSGGKGGSGSGGSGGGSGSGGSGGGGVGSLQGNADDMVSEGRNQIESEFSEWAKRIAAALKAVWEALKTGWNSVSDYISQSLDKLKAAFAKLGTALVDFCVGAWNNGGKELFEAIGRFAGSVVGAVLDIASQIVDAIANTINYLNPETNKFTAGFISALTYAFNQASELVLSLGGYFALFMANGGQAFLNVMGDIAMLVGDILFTALGDAIGMVKAFLDSWVGQAVLTTVAMSLDIIAGAIKAILIVVKECLPALEALAGVFGLFGILKVKNDFFELFGILKNGTGNVKEVKDRAKELSDTLGGGLAVKLDDLKLKLMTAQENLSKFVKDGLKNTKDAVKDTKKAISDFGDTSKKKLKDVVKWFDDLGKKSVKGVKDLGKGLLDGTKKLLGFSTSQATAATTTATLTGAQAANATATTAAATAEGVATVATAGLTAGTIALGIALAALGITVIIAAIAGLIAIIRNWGSITDWIKGIATNAFEWIKDKVEGLAERFEWVGTVWEFLKGIFKSYCDGLKEFWGGVYDFIEEKCGWLVTAVKWVGDQFSWAWGKIKGFFGFEDGENKISEETEQTEEDLNGLGDTMEEVSDRFGTSCSVINESLASIGIDGNKIALQLDAVEAMFDEKFNMVSANAREYLDAVAEGNQDVLNEMSGDADKYLGEIKSAFNDMSLEEQAIFYSTYGEINGVTDGWLDYTSGSYEECLVKHAAMLDAIENNESLTYDEKKARIEEEKNAFVTAQNEKLRQLNLTIAEMEAQEWQSEEEKNQALKGYYEQRNQLVDEMNQYQIGAIEDTADAQAKANEEMSTAADGAAKAQEEALAKVDTALETTKGNLTTFKTESEKVATEIPTAWEGVGETISDEFEGAIADVGTNFNSILTNTKKQCDQLKSGIKKTFDEVKSGTKKAMIEVTSTITDQFSKAVSAVNKAGNDLKSNLQTTLNNIASGIKKSFDTIKTSMTTSFTQAASSVQKALNDCKSKISSTLASVNSDVSSKTNTIKNTISNNFKDVKSKLTKPFEGLSGTIGNSLDGIKSTISGRLDSIVSKVNSSVTRMKNAMNFTFPKPYLRLPHISVHGDWNFETKKVPKFSVQWYAKGGIMTNPTAFGMNGNNLMVGGEAGPEAILPIDTLFDKMNDMFDTQNQVLASTMINNNSTAPVTLTLEMNGEKVAKATVKSMQDLARIGALDMNWI